MIFNKDWDFIDTWGEGKYTRPHSIFIDDEDFYGSVEFLVTPPFISDLNNATQALKTFTKELDEWGLTQTPFRKAFYKA